MEVSMARILAILVFLSLQDPKTTEIGFSVPAGTDQRVVDKAAAQLRRRIEDYGYKGVHVHLEGGVLRISFAPGLTPAMITAIERLSKVRGDAYLWAVVQLSEKELEQWIPGKTSPPGTSWLIDGDRKSIMDNSWKIPMDVRFERVTKVGFPDTARLGFSKADSKKFFDRLSKEKNSKGFTLMLDGKRFPHQGKLRERDQFDPANGTFTKVGILDWVPTGELDEETLVGMVSIASQLPVELTRAK